MNQFLVQNSTYSNFDLFVQIALSVLIQEYVEELARLLTIAKHPGVVTLLKTSIANAKTTSPSHAQQLPASKKVAGEKHGTSTIKIKEYGKLCALFRSVFFSFVSCLPAFPLRSRVES